MRPACRIRLQPSVAGVQPASRVRFAGPCPPLTPLAHRNTGSPTHSKFNRGIFLSGYARAEGDMSGAWRPGGLIPRRRLLGMRSHVNALTERKPGLVWG